MPLQPHAILVSALTLSLLAGACGLAAGSARAEDGKKPAPKDAEGIQGTWLPLTADFGGEPFPEETRKSIKLILKGDKYTVISGEEKDQGTFKLDTSAKPKAMDILGTNGPNKGRTLPAIYELDGDKLRVCYDLSGKSRPTEFASKKETLLFLVTYTREAAKQ